MGDGSEPDQGFFGKMKSAGKRAITGESLFMTHFTNGGGRVQQVAFAAPYPGKIVPADLATLGGRIICQKDAFLCAAMGTKIGITFNRKLGTGFLPPKQHASHHIECSLNCQQQHSSAIPEWVGRVLGSATDMVFGVARVVTGPLDEGYTKM